MFEQAETGLARNAALVANCISKETKSGCVARCIVRDIEVVWILGV